MYKKAEKISKIGQWRLLFVKVTFNIQWQMTEPHPNVQALPMREYNFYPYLCNNYKVLR